MLGNYKVGARLTAGFAIAAALTAVTGLVGFTGLRSIGAAADDLGRSQLPSVESLGSVEAGQASVIVAERALANPLLVRPELRQAQYAFIEKNMAAAEAALAVYDKIPRDSAEDASYRDLVSTWADWKAKHGEVVSMSQDKDRLLASGAKLSDPRIRAMDTRTFETSLSSREAFLAVRANLDKLIKSADTQAASASAAATAASRRATTILILFVLAAAGLAAAMGVALTRSITQPLKGMSEAADRIALGDVEQTLEHHSQDELGKLADAFRALISYITDISHAADALARGDLSVEPKPRSADDALSANMGRAIGALRLMVADTGRLAIAGREGELATRADASVHEGDYRRIVQGVNDTLDAVIGPLNVTAECVDRISKGDIPAKITDNYNGDFNHIKNNLNACIDAVNALVTDANMLSKAAVEGRLETRADATKHQGDFRKVVQGVNDTLDAVIGPLNVAAAAIDRIGQGEIPEKITDNYSGDFNHLKNNLNACIDGLAGLVEADEILQRMAVNDYTRKVEGSYQGVFADVAAATNEVNNRISNTIRISNQVAVGDYARELEALRSVGRRSEQDTLVPAFIKMMSSIDALVADAERLSQAAVEGKLETRADAAKHSGEYRKVVEGVNATLDAMGGPINEASNVLQLMAERDMTARMQGNYRGDFDRIKQALNTAAENLDESLQQVAVGAEQVANASVEISTGAQTLSQGASEQAASLEEISSNLQEMASMTRQNAGNAKEAQSLADGAKAAADKGASAMQRMSEAVDRIKTSSDQTAKIVKTIDEIAFQTNLLALNAAVEAARAGDAGKGFAVVAEEVRNLAMRSAEAAKNTASMIEEAVKNAEGGVAINHEVMTSLNEITDQAGKVSEVMAEIAAASDQQTQGIDQVNVAVSQMDSLTQANAANSEESASAAEELSSQAEEMQSMAAAFRLSNESKHASRPAMKRPAARKPVGGRVPAGVGASRGRHDPDPSAVIPFDSDERELANF